MAYFASTITFMVTFKNVAAAVLAHVWTMHHLIDEHSAKLGSTIVIIPGKVDEVVDREKFLVIKIFYDQF